MADSLEDGRRFARGLNDGEMSEEMIAWEIGKQNELGKSGNRCPGNARDSSCLCFELGEMLLRIIFRVEHSLKSKLGNQSDRKSLRLFTAHRP